MLADLTRITHAPIPMAVKDELVTVVLPCFNHEKFVEQAICSVFQQTYANIELIVIDDCSSDNSVTVIQNLQQQYNFQFIQNKVNKGVQANLQDIVINHALGEYVKVLDADDYLLPEGIELLVSGFNGLDDSYGFIFGDYYENFAGNIVLKKFNYDYSQGIDKNHHNAIWLENINPSSIYKRAAFISFGGFEKYTFLEDKYLWLRFIRNGYKFKYLNKPVAVYRRFNNPLSKSATGLLNSSKAYTSLMFSKINYIHEVAVENGNYTEMSRQLLQITRSTSRRYIVNTALSLIYTNKYQEFFNFYRRYFYFVDFKQNRYIIFMLIKRLFLRR